MNQQSEHLTRRRPWRRAALAATLLAGTSLGGFAVGHTAWADSVAPVNPPGAQLQPHALPDFTGLVTQVKPAVVSITTKFRATPAALEDEGGGQQRGNQMPQLPFPFNQMVPNSQQQQEHAVEARGSGFIISADGTIVTNNHVVKDARSVSVTLDDGTVLPAKVIGKDPRTDIAILKVVSAKPLPYIQLGNSRDVKPGEWVVAMGNPFGLGGTVTAGIVSAISRDIGAGPYDQFIQVDAPINQGNSGGPLFTQDGKVIGMNTAILSPNGGGSVGIGFAIPSDMIRTVSAQLEKSGHVTRGFVGVEAQQITGATATALHLSEGSGALLAGVQPGSPAAASGLQAGDVIEAVNGTKIANPKELAMNVASIQPGEEAHLSVLHDGQTKDVTIKVGQLPNEQAASNDNPTKPHHAELGLALAPLSPDVRDQFDVPEGTRGAIVERVQPGSPAESAGLQPGDVIVGVGTHAVTSPSEAAQQMRSAMGGSDRALALRVIRNGQPVFVGVNLDASNQG